jgi:hypothetical protein
MNIIIIYKLKQICLMYSFAVTRVVMIELIHKYMHKICELLTIPNLIPLRHATLQN